MFRRVAPTCGVRKANSSTKFRKVLKANGDINILNLPICSNFFSDAWLGSYGTMLVRLINNVVDIHATTIVIGIIYKCVCIFV